MNIKRIEADIQTAKYNISDSNNPTNDEFLYDIAAYHTQQAIEKTLKYYLHNIYGEDDTSKPFRTHNISTLLLKINKYDPKFTEKHQDLIDISDELTNWEASTRYGECSISVKSSIEHALNIAENLLSELKEREYRKINDPYNIHPIEINNFKDKIPVSELPKEEISKDINIDDFKEDDWKPGDF